MLARVQAVFGQASCKMRHRGIFERLQHCGLLDFGKETTHHRLPFTPGPCDKVVLGVVGKSQAGCASANFFDQRLTQGQLVLEQVGVARKQIFGDCHRLQRFASSVDFSSVLIVKICRDGRYPGPMKRRFFILILLAGCAGNSSFTINVTGSGPFSGSIMVLRDGKAEQRSVEGTAPTSYSETGSTVSVSFQKKGTGGTLGVDISKDGHSVASQSTTAEYGVVTAATQ